MKAFVLDAGTKQGALADVPVPEPGPGEALVKVLRAGVCNTDLELLQGCAGGRPGEEGGAVDWRLAARMHDVLMLPRACLL